MDMEEHFYFTQEKLKKMIDEIKEIEVKEYHESIKTAKEEALKALKKLYDEHEF